MPANKPCPHCNRPVEDWHREWYSQGHQKAQYNHASAANCPYSDCEGGVDLYAKEDKVLVADPSLPINRRSWKQAVKWKGSEEDLKDYIAKYSPGQQYTNYPWDP
jgi:hypothetical protein